MGNCVNWYLLVCLTRSNPTEKKKLNNTNNNNNNNNNNSNNSNVLGLYFR